MLLVVVVLKALRSFKVFEEVIEWYSEACNEF